MDKKQDTFPNEALAEINVKLEQILQNQEQLFDLLGQIGSALVYFYSHILQEAIVHTNLYHQLNRAESENHFCFP